MFCLFCGFKLWLIGLWGLYVEGEGIFLLRVFFGIIEGVLFMEEIDVLRVRKIVGWGVYFKVVYYLGKLIRIILYLWESDFFIVGIKGVYLGYIGVEKNN